MGISESPVQCHLHEADRLRALPAVGSTHRRGRLAFPDTGIEAAPQTGTRKYVAIDRVNGGSLDKHLFDWVVVTSGQIHLTVTALEHITHAERNLLLHVVRDLHDGLIGIGGGAQRGHGTLAVCKSHRHLLDEVAALDDVDAVGSPT